MTHPPRTAAFTADVAGALRRLAGPSLALAAVAAAGLMACTAAPGLLRSTNPASADVLLALIALPMWCCLLLAFGAHVLAGRLDRWLGARALQGVLVPIGITLLSAASCHGAQHASWAAYLLPSAALMAALALHWQRR